MKANELRIGSWFGTFEINKSDGIEYFQIESFNQNKEKMLGVEFRKGSCWSVIDFLEPIPLKEEWLIKFGFERENKNWHNKSFNGLWSIHIRLSDGRIELQCINDDEEASSEVDLLQLPIEVKFVHQLQNFWKANTGEELTIKE